MLRRELSKIDNYATLIGMLIGAGIFVAIGEAGKDSGPATVLAYLALGPVTLLLALPYVIFQSTPLGNFPGGAYIHISRTFKNHYFGFIVMWLSWITYLGVLAVLSISVGNYLQAIFPSLNPKYVATFCLIAFYLINLVGVKNFGRMQRWMFYLLILSVLLLIIPGLFTINVQNFTPFLPKGWSGFFTALPVLFFAYAGFDALSQTAGETKDARKSLPKIFIFGIIFAMIIYVGISLVAFGNLKYTALISSSAPLIEAAQNYLPYGSIVVTIGALMAFLSTINACMMVPSRILFAFSKDHIAPKALSKLNTRFDTPHVSLTINLVLPLILIWTKTISYLLSISMQTITILYIAECAALMLLPYVNKPLWRQTTTKIKKKYVVAGGALGVISLLILYVNIPNPSYLPLVIWIAIGTGFYLIEKRAGKITGIDYSKSFNNQF